MPTAPIAAEEQIRLSKEWARRAQLCAWPAGLIGVVSQTCAELLSRRALEGSVQVYVPGEAQQGARQWERGAFHCSRLHREEGDHKDQ